MKLAIITGGSRGLGSKIVDILKDEYKIIEYSRSGKFSFSYNMDFTSPKTIKEKVEDSLKGLNVDSIEELIIISNAGSLTPLKRVKDLEPEEIINHINMNVVSSSILISTLISHFRELNGVKKVINISSGAALGGYPAWSLYCASKAANENFIESLILEEESEKYPFKLFNFDPGVMDTDMQKEIRGTDESIFPYVERFKNFKKDGDLRTPEEVATKLITLIKNCDFDRVRYTVKEL